MQETSAENTLSVQIALFDKQHMYLVELMNDFKKAIADKESKANLVKRFIQLITDVKDHFKDEETLMIKYDFKGYESHKKSHDSLLKRVGLQYEEYQRNSFYFNLSKFVEELEQEIIRHILYIDKKYSAHLMAHGVK